MYLKCKNYWRLCDYLTRTKWHIPLMLQLQAVGNKFCIYKSFKFVLFNESFPNPAKFQIRPKFGRSRISAGFVKRPDFGRSESRTAVQPYSAHYGNVTYTNANLTYTRSDCLKPADKYTSHQSKPLQVGLQVADYGTQARQFLTSKTINLHSYNTKYSSMFPTQL